LAEQQERHQQQQEEEEVVGMVNESPKKNGKRKALIIGISKYDRNNKFSNLDFCENNANEIYSILKAQGYNIPANALLVGRVEWTRMRDEIIDFFEDSTLKPDDTLFFYFSGHGLIDKNTDRTYLSTSEIDPASPKKRGIPFEDLTTYINDSNSERIIAVLDCCYSNAFEVAGKGGGGGEEESAKAEKDEEIADSANTNMRKAVEHLITSGQGKCVLASSLEEQRSFKMKDQPYSTFTYFLIQGLRGANGESVGINGYVTLELLSSYVNKKIYELPTIKQKPIRKIEVTGEIILAHYPSLARRQQQTFQKSSHLLQLLRKGNIDEFNEIRKKDNYSRLDFYNVDLSGLSLSHADLRKSNLISANLGESKLQHATFEETTLLGAHLEGADVSKANVSKADLLEADLEGTNLEGADVSKSDVSKADLVEADVSKADVSEANLSFANLSNADLVEADVSEADLVEANLSKADLVEANLSNADLSEANLVEANLSKANLSNADLVEADVSKANVSEANLSKADLVEANLVEANLSKANLSNADLVEAYVSKANLSFANLSFANLSFANLSKANLSNADLSFANLSNADLSEANLVEANLSKANLSNADLSFANLSKADLSNADLSEANLASSIIIGAKFLVKNNKKCYPRFKNAEFNDSTIIDDEELWRHLCNNDAKNVPATVKNTKELREKLEQRGFDTETIDWLLSFSSLPDPSA
jgi:uncharacterized protein YjbI with pentapeptide repeats